MLRRLREQTQPPDRAGRRRAPCALLTLALAGGLLAACGGDDDADDAAGPDSTTTSEPAAHGEMASGDASPVPDDARHVPVTARSYAFEPAEITVETGEPIAIVLTAEDAAHHFVIDEVDAQVSSDAGQTGIGGFSAPETPGRYAFYCAMDGHRGQGMEGTLVVEAAP